MVKAVGVAGLVVLLPVLLVAVILGGGGASQAAAIGPAGLSSALRAGSVPAAYVQLVEDAGAMCPAAPAPIIAAQIDQESAWNPSAVSAAGAEGISQFLPSTWPSWAQPPTASPFDPAAAIPAQGRYDCAIAAQLAPLQQLGKLGNSSLTELMLAGYNAGPNAVIAAGGIPNNPQTQAYFPAILAKAATYAAPAAASGAFGASMVAFAQSQIGVPYAWDGGSYTGPTIGVCAPDGAENDCHIVGFDCSGLVMAAAFYASGGHLRLPHSAAEQVTYGTRVPANRAAVSSSMQPGDVIAFTDPGEIEAHHIGIYIGGEQMIDAPESGELVRVDALNTSYYQGQTWAVARLG